MYGFTQRNHGFEIKKRYYSDEDTSMGGPEILAESGWERYRWHCGKQYRTKYETQKCVILRVSRPGRFMCVIGSTLGKGFRGLP